MTTTRKLADCRSKTKTTTLRKLGAPTLQHGMTFDELMLALRYGGAYVNGTCRHVSHIEREDGSGHNFNVHVYPLPPYAHRHTEAIYVRTS